MPPDDDRTARSGLPRQIEIWFAAVGDRIYLLSGGRDRSHWVRNLRSNPEVQFRVRRRTFEGRASVVEGTADDPIARDALGAKYGAEGLADWLRDSLPVKITIEREIPESGG